MISVIVPVYNIEPYIGRCIDSILSNTYTDFEILLIDDGSTDNSGVICDNYAKEDERIRVFHKKNGGVSSARNLALKNIRGEYVIFIDGDDWIKDDLFEDFVQETKKHKVDVFMYEYYINCPDKVIEHKVAEENYGVIDTEDALVHNITPDNRIIASKILAANLIQGDKFDESIILGEDTLFLTSVMTRAKTIVYTDKAYYYYDQRENSAVRSQFSEKKLSGLVAYKKQIELLNRMGFARATEYARGAYTELAIALARRITEDDKYSKSTAKDVLKLIKKGIREESREIYKSGYLSKKIKMKVFVSAVSIRLTCMLCRIMGEK